VRAKDIQIEIPATNHGHKADIWPGLVLILPLQSSQFAAGWLYVRLSGLTMPNSVSLERLTYFSRDPRWTAA